MPPTRPIIITTPIPKLVFIPTIPPLNPRRSTLLPRTSKIPNRHQPRNLNLTNPRQLPSTRQPQVPPRLRRTKRIPHSVHSARNETRRPLEQTRRRLALLPRLLRFFRPASEVFFDLKADFAFHVRRFAEGEIRGHAAVPGFGGGEGFVEGVGFVV